MTRESFSEERRALRGSPGAGSRDCAWGGWERCEDRLSQDSNPPLSPCSRAPAADGPVPEMHPPGPGPPAPAGHQLPAPASVSQELSAVPVSRGSGGTHSLGLSLLGHTVHQEGVSLPTPVCRNIQFFERPGRLPQFGNTMSVAKRICCLGSHPPKSDTSLEARKSLEPAPGWRSCPAEQDAAATDIDP